MHEHLKQKQIIHLPVHLAMCAWSVSEDLNKSTNLVLSTITPGFELTNNISIGFTMVTEGRVPISCA